MLKHYTGDWQNCPDNIEGLLAIGVEVRWTKCWRYNFGKAAQHLDDRKWHVLKNIKVLEAASCQTRRLQEKWWGIPTWADFSSFCVITYRIDDEKYPLLCARYREWERETDELARQELERMHEEAIAERQRKIDAYLKKYPWRGEPECWQEGIDWLVDHEGENGPVVVNMRGKAV